MCLYHTATAICIRTGLLLESAKARSDGKKVLDFIGVCDDLVASEARYHKSCFREFTRRPKESQRLVTEGSMACHNINSLS